MTRKGGPSAERTRGRERTHPRSYAYHPELVPLGRRLGDNPMLVESVDRLGRFLFSYTIVARETDGQRQTERERERESE